MSVEEDKHGSDSASHHSFGSKNSKEKRQSTASSARGGRKSMKQTLKKNEIINESATESEDDEKYHAKKPKMKVWANAGHIELKDLTEKDFLDMIESKHSEGRNFWWVHERLGDKK